MDGLYLHVPFCFHKCHYCDFYSIVDDRDRQATFVARLIEELRHHRDAAGGLSLRPATVFVGGGTPTLLRPELWQRLLAALHEAGGLDAAREFTVEANPETVTAELMRVLGAGGVNRISLGAQSFDRELLRGLERWHEPESVRRAVDAVRAAGIANVNLDLIFAIPGQTLAQVDADLDAALRLGPTHLSYYGLTYEPHTPLTQRLQRGQVQAVEEDAERAMYERIIARLAAAGFEHYEVSNWAAKEFRVSGFEFRVRTGAGNAREGGGPDLQLETIRGRNSKLETRPVDFRCHHNLTYWHNRNWLGLGPAAASHIAGRRWKNQPHLGHYLASHGAAPRIDDECLPPARRVGEALMLGLRLREGVRLDWLHDALPADDPRRATIVELEGLGLLERTATHLRLPHRGLLVADAVIAKLL